MEFFRKAPQGIGNPEISDEADIVVLAGDIDVGISSLLFAESIAQKYSKDVIWLPGNHEFYQHDYSELKQEFISRALKAQSNGVHALLGFKNTELPLFFDKEDTRFTGATMWTDFELYLGSARLPDTQSAINASAGSINDFRIIKNGQRAFSPEDSIEAHKEAVEVINTVLEMPFDGPKVVITHHGPIKESIHPIYSSDSRYLNSRSRLPGENPSWIMNCCFTSNHQELFAKSNIWIHGHTHQSIDLNVQNSRLITNPRGYPVAYKDGKVVWENPNFNPIKLIELPTKSQKLKI